MARKPTNTPKKSCSNCIHECACRMWTDGREISDESASRCTNHTTTKESAAYLIGKMDGEKTAIPVDEHRKLLREMYLQGKFDGASEAEAEREENKLPRLTYEEFKAEVKLVEGHTVSEEDLRAMYEAYIDDGAEDRS